MFIAGLHVPVMPSSEVAGNGESTAPSQMGATALNVGVMIGLMVTIPVTDSETQPVLLFVIITLYVPPTVVEKVATLPGLITPAGTVHAYEYVPAWEGVAVMVAEDPSQAVGELTVTVVSSAIVTLVMQFEILPHASSTVHVIVETPALNLPLASFPVPSLSVAPVIW